MLLELPAGRPAGPGPPPAPLRGGPWQAISCRGCPMRGARLLVARISLSPGGPPTTGLRRRWRLRHPVATPGSLLRACPHGQPVNICTRRPARIRSWLNSLPMRIQRRPARELPRGLRLQARRRPARARPARSLRSSRAGIAPSRRSQGGPPGGRVAAAGVCRAHRTRLLRLSRPCSCVQLQRPHTTSVGVIQRCSPSPPTLIPFCPPTSSVDPARSRRSSSGSWNIREWRLRRCTRAGLFLPGFLPLSGRGFMMRGSFAASLCMPFLASRRSTLTGGCLSPKLGMQPSSGR